MVPPKTDPKWESFLDNLGSVSVSSMGTRVLLTKLMLMHYQKDAEKRKKAIDEAYSFFSKNENAVKEDIKLIFG